MAPPYRKTCANPLKTSVFFQRFCKIYLWFVLLQTIRVDNHRSSQWGCPAKKFFDFYLGKLTVKRSGKTSESFFRVRFFDEAKRWVLAVVRTR